jgi:hypothetical protein
VTVTHVDLVRNEWSAGLQVRVARIDDRGLSSEVSRAQPGWREVLDRPVEPVGNLLNQPLSVAFPLLDRSFANEYFFVTEPHEDSECSFSESDVVEMQHKVAPADKGDAGR